DLPAALDTLRRALLLAQPEGYVRIFLDEGAPMMKLLSEIGKADVLLQGYVQRLLVPSKGASAQTPLSTPDNERSSNQSLLDPLSERELEVLRLLAAGASNEEIADRLVIAVGTAKRRVSNILAKLAVPNRTQAVARAR